MDRFDEWTAYVAVANARSFTRAAHALGKSPQAMTRAVASLEDRLGYRLLHRTTRAVSTTPEGRAALERGRRLLEDLKALELPEHTAPLAGTLTITAPVLFGQLHVLPLIAEMLALHPQLDVKLVLVDRVVSLAEEAVDVAIRIGALADSALKARIVGAVRAVCVASPAYLRRAPALDKPDDLAHHDVIAFTGVTPVPDRWSFGTRSVAVRPRLVVNTGEAALAAAAAGVGVARVLSYQTRSSRELRAVLDEHAPPPMPVQIVTLPGVPARAAPAFVDLATARLKQRLAL